MGFKMTVAQAAKRMVEILSDESLQKWDVENKIAMLVQEFVNE